MFVVDFDILAADITVCLDIRGTIYIYVLLVFIICMYMYNFVVDFYGFVRHVHFLLCTGDKIMAFMDLVHCCAYACILMTIND